MTRDHDDERDDLLEEARPAAPAIPGAWAAPAGAFVDEGSVVRPERHANDRAQGRMPRLLLLAVLSAATAGFAWGVTVALQGLEEEATSMPGPELAAVQPAAEVGSAPRPVDEAEGPAVEGEGDEPRGTPLALEGAEAEASLPVPAADPTFPGLPTAADEVEGRDDAEASDDVDDAPAPKRARGAGMRLALDDEEDAAGGKKQRYKRPSQKGKKLAKGTTSKRSAKATKAAQKRGLSSTSEGGDDKAPPAAADESRSKAAPATASSLTLEAEKLFARGELSPARALAERAIERSSGYPRAHRALAVICAKQGDSACARSGYEAYLKLAPDAPDAPDVRRILGM